MSEGDVSLIRDEDVLRRLWQQTEDFSRKKEIRAHMYRLREERLRNLYSPEPTSDINKGCEFTSPQGHVQSFADQTFQSMKSKEVRDAGSPPKEFTYRGQDLKDLSNAGWNVESENKTTDDGHTHVKSVNANIEGRYDVEGGKGKFAATDHHHQAVTEYQDENSSLKRNESSSKTAAHEQVVRKTDDGSHFTSTTSSSSTSKFEQISSKHETVPYTDDYDQRKIDTNRNEQLTKDNYEQTLRKNDDHGELMSRKVEYPDENTKVIVETRRMPDGTRVTSTKREFRAPVHSTHSEHHSQSRTENKYSTTHKTDQTAASKTIRYTDNTINDIVDAQRNVDNYDFKRRVIDDDFAETHSAKNYETNIARKVIDTTNDDNYSTSSRYETSKINKKIIDTTNTGDDYSINQYEKINKKVIDCNQNDNVEVKTTRHETNDDNYSESTRYVTKINRVTDDLQNDRRPNRRPDESFDDVDCREITVIHDDKTISRKDNTNIRDTKERIHTVTKDTKEQIIDRKTTYQTDYAQKKISTDWSPTHQAWASTLRSDTPSTTRPSTRASSPGSRTFKSSTSSLRSSVSPDKTSRKPSSRGNSPNKLDRNSPSRTITDRYSSTHSSHSVTEFKSATQTGSGGRPPTGRSPTRPGYSPDRKLQDRQRPSVSPDKRPNDYTQRPSTSPERKPVHKAADSHPDSLRRPQSPNRRPDYQPTSRKPDNSTYHRAVSPQRNVSDKITNESPKNSTRPSPSPERKTTTSTPTKHHPSSYNVVPRTTSPSKPNYPNDTEKRLSASPDRKPGYRPTGNHPYKSTDETSHKQRASPDRKEKFDHLNPTSQPVENVENPTEPTSSRDFKSPKNNPESSEVNDGRKLTKIKGDHYKFIDEETKIYTKTDKIDTKIEESVPHVMKPRDKNLSPSRKSPDKQVQDIVKIPTKPESYKQPEQIIATHDEKYNKYDDFDSKYVLSINTTEHNTTKDSTSKHKDVRKTEYSRESSPNKHKICDVKQLDNLKDRSDTDKSEPHYGREPSPSKDRVYHKKHPHDIAKDGVLKENALPKSRPDKEPSPMRQVKKQPEDENKYHPTAEKCSPIPQPIREPSPSKYSTYDKKQTRDRVSTDEDKFKAYPNREISPTTHGSHDKKQPRNEVKTLTPKDKDSSGTHDISHREPSPTKLDRASPDGSSTIVTERNTTVIKKATKDTRTQHDSITRSEKITSKSPDDPELPVRKTPRDSVSPVKSPTKDKKYKYTNDFLVTERTTEEINKKSTTKDRPRQLVTPSTSPTRKSKTETELSTGQSSPTTSVSEFVYFGSPPREKTEVTDIDDLEYYSKTRKTVHRPDGSDVHYTPTKMADRSPSPEKHISSVKDNLPRKSSLKKPVVYYQESPMEKPPSNFEVSPTNDEDVSHKILKKDQPVLEDQDTAPKPKPPLERRETYEDRCKKILGMDNVKETTIQQTKYKNKPETKLISPTISPRESLAPNDSLLFEEQLMKKETKDVTDFITQEKENIIKTTHRHDISSDIKHKSSRESSPTKLQDIITITTTEDKTINNLRESPDKKLKHTSPKDDSIKSHKYSGATFVDTVKPNQIADNLRSKSPKKDDNGPKKKSVYEKTTSINQDTFEPSDENPQYSPLKISSDDPEKKPGITKKTTDISENITLSTEDIQQNLTSTITEKKHSSTKLIESPSHNSPKTNDNQPRSVSPSKEVRKEDTKRDVSPKKQISIKVGSNKIPDNNYPQTSSPNRAESVPGYMKTTASVVSKHDTTENVYETTPSKTVEEKLPKKNSEEPTRKSPNKDDNEPIHSKPSKLRPQDYDISPERVHKNSRETSPTKTNHSFGLTETIETFKKHDTLLNNEEVDEIIVSKTVTQTYPNRLSISPIRQTQGEVESKESPSKSKNLKDCPGTTITKQTDSKNDNKTPTSKTQDVKKHDITVYEKPKSSSPARVDFPKSKDNSPTRDSLRTEKQPAFKPSSPTQHTLSKKPQERYPKDSSPTRPRKTMDNTITVTTMTSESDTVHGHKKSRRSESPTQPGVRYHRTSNEKSPIRDTISPERKPDYTDASVAKTIKRYPNDTSPIRINKTIGHVKTVDVSSTQDTVTSITGEITSSKIINKTRTTSPSPTRHSPERMKFKPQCSRENSSDLIKQPQQKSPTRGYISPERKPTHEQAKSIQDETSRKKPENKYPHDSAPSPNDNIPGYMRTTTSATSKYDTTGKIEHAVESVRTIEFDHTKSTFEHPKTTSKSSYPQDVDGTERKPVTGQPKSLSPTRSGRTPSYVKTTTAMTTKHTNDEETIASRIIEKKQTSSSTLKDKKDTHHKTSPSHPRNTSPTKINSNKNSSPPSKPGLLSTPRDSAFKKPSTADKHPKSTAPIKSEDNIPGYMKPTSSVTSKYEASSTKDVECITSDEVDQHPSRKTGLSPPRHVPEELQKPNRLDSLDEPRQLRTPSPIKKFTKVTEVSTDFIISEKEQEILDRVQKSLRKLSPERKTRSPSSEKSLTSKTTTSLHNLDLRKNIETEEFIIDEKVELKEEVPKVHTPHPKSKEEKVKEQKDISKPRTVSPVKKPGIPNPVKVDKKPESPSKSRSISPKKPYGERPQSPQLTKFNTVKSKEQVPVYLTRKPTPATITTTKIEKAITMEVKRSTTSTKQNISKTSVKATASKFMSTTKPEIDPKRMPVPKSVKEYPKKDIDIKVTRTTSDNNLKSKKTSPQRMKSKPEIQVNDLSTPKITKSLKSVKEPQPKFQGKPKSATSLNTSTDEDDVIIDVQQSKSSRENSPDRICPTPVNFSDDVGTPRFPDQVSEPDDDLRKRTHHTIHETESLVDDIVEICEDDELFVKRTNVKNISEHDESLLSVHDKVSKFTNKIKSVTKPKESTALFKDHETKGNSDFIDQNLKSDECLLSVSEKVNKFAKGPYDTRESKSPSRKIIDEYDNNTIYQDDYTKLSVNDKAHLFVETAENVKTTKSKPAQKVERPDLSNVDEALKSDDCLLSVSDKVNKFVKTAEQFLTETQEVEEKDKKIKEQHDKIMRQIVDDSGDETETTEYTEEVVTERVEKVERKSPDRCDEKTSVTTKTVTAFQSKTDENNVANLKTTEKTPVKITTLRSSEAVKKAKAVFENIASTTQKTKETSNNKLASIVTKKISKIASNNPQPTIEDSTPYLNNEYEIDSQDHKESPSGVTPTRPHETTDRISPSRHRTQSPESRHSKSPMHHTIETSTKTVVMKNPTAPGLESPKHRPESDKQDNIPGYLRPTKTSQIKEEKHIEETDVSTRRGSGKFGVELRRTSVDQAPPTGERRRSGEHPCIEDIFDLELLEQMLEKVVGYEQRRRIRAQIRVARKSDETNTFTKTTKTILNVPKSKSTESHKSPERSSKSPQKSISPERRFTPSKALSQSREGSVTNSHIKEPVDKPRAHRPESSEKITPKPTSKNSSRQSSPEKKTHPQSPAKTPAKPKSNRFNEYATAYMKKVGLNDSTKPKITETKKLDTHRTSKQIEEHTTVEEYSTSKTFTERTSTKDVIETVQQNGRTPSPQKRQSPERKLSPQRQERSPSPEVQRRKSSSTKETIIKTVHDIDKKIQPKVVQEDKPSWVTNRNLKKITSETRTISSKKMEPEKPKYRAASPSKTVSKPIDAITSSYGPGPLDSDGKPLFGIRALRKGSSNYQVKGTVIRQEFHSKNGGEPEGTVSVTAYSTEPEELERLLQSQGAPPSRLHGLAAITTTKKFGGDSGTTIHEAHGKEERAALDQFTHSDRRVSDYELDSVEDTFDSEVAETRRSIIEEQSTRDDGETVYKETIGHRRVQEDEGEIVYRQETKEERIVYEDGGETVYRQETKGNRRVQEDEKETVHRQELKGHRRGQANEEEIVHKQQTKGLRSENIQERKEKTEMKGDKKTVRQNSVKSLTEKYIKNANDSSKSERTSYPKAGLILRTATMKDSISSDSSAHAGLARTDSEHSLGSVDETVVTTTERIGDGIRTTTTTTRHQERSFLDNSSKVTGVQDILTRMKNADIVIEDGDTTEDTEARALLNKFLGASVLMAGMQGYVTEKPSGKVIVQETVLSSSGGDKVSSSRTVEEIDLDQCWDERLLKKLLEECTDYEQRRRLRARIRTLMAEQEACASAVTEALAAAGETESADGGETRGESLLLPLLQGLLGGAGDRLLAGLGAAPADVVADVRRSLARLRAALAPPAQHPQARALLTLADRLEDALDAANRLDGCRRKPRRRSRAARHTVGVTHEELEEARRLVDRDQLTLGPEPVDPPSSSGAASTASTAAGTESTTPERKPSLEEVSYHDAVPARRKEPPIPQAATYEPPKVNREAIAVERRVPVPKRPEYFRHSVAEASRAEPQLRTESRPSDVKSSIATIANKFDTRTHLNAQTTKESVQPVGRNPSPPVRRQNSREEPRRTSVYIPLPPTYNFAAPPASFDDSSKPAGRFNATKKLRMKRANTIDIGRPLGGYRVESDTDEEQRQPVVPEFTPQTDNDRKFVAFMKKNEQTEREPAPHSNWSSRFGNIKNTFENRDHEVGARSSSASSARSFWKANEANAPALRPRKFVAEPNSAVVKPPWVTERREPARVPFTRPTYPPPASFNSSANSHIPPAPIPPYHSTSVSSKVPQTYPAAPVTLPNHAHFPRAPSPPTPSTQPLTPQTPTKPLVVKPFAARPIPVNQFSHAPMSAFKPPAKIASPTRIPAHVWSPPSTGTAPSPATEVPVLPFSYPTGPPTLPLYPPAPPLYPPGPDPATLRPAPVSPRAVPVVRESDRQPLARFRPAAYETTVTLAPAHVPAPTLAQSNRPIPTQSELAAPELVRRVDDARLPAPKPDAQRLQIEFYERQIRERNRRDPEQRPTDRKPPTYTVTDYTPPSGVTAFVPLQRTPDIERTRVHKVDYLPDVVTNDTDRPHPAPRHPPSPRSPQHVPSPRPLTNGDSHRVNGIGDDVTTEHGSVVTRVMRGPVRGNATITTGVRTRNDEARADSLRGALEKVSSPKREALAQMERRRREASRDSIGSSSSTASMGSAPLSRSGSWQAMAGKPSSPRKVVARAKSMHLLAVPKLYEGGIAREQAVEKKRSVEAYFAGRVSNGRAREPVGTGAYALGRSRTMPAVTELQFLDESNADDAFEDLVSALA